MDLYLLNSKNNFLVSLKSVSYIFYISIESMQSFHGKLIILK